MLPSDNIQSIVGATLHDPDGDKIGTIKQVYVDAGDGHPTWVKVSVGTIARHSTFVPLDEATWEDDSVTVPYDKELVKRAPRLDPEHGLDPDQEQELQQHYRGTPAVAPDSNPAASSRDPDARNDAHQTDDHDRSHDDVDPAHVDRSSSGDTELDDQGVLWEERLVVHKEKVPVAKVHLEKTTVTENREVTVDVQKERVVLEQEDTAPPTAH